MNRDSTTYAHYGPPSTVTATNPVSVTKTTTGKLAAALATVALLIASPGWAQQSPPQSAQPTPTPAAALPGRFRAGEVVVGFRPSVPPGQRDAVAVAEGHVARHLSALNAVVIKVPPGKEGETLARLKNRGEVRYAEVNGITGILEVPTDPQFGAQWHFHNTGQSGGTVDADVDGPEAWDVTRGSESVRIAVVDTGVDCAHPDLAGACVGTADFTGDGFFDAHSHGTFVAGVAAARTNNGVAGAGMCPRCSLLAAKVFDGTGTGSWDQVAQGIVWAADNGAHVVNLSLGDQTYSDTLIAAVRYAHERGAIIVGAAGNTGDPAVHFPASFGEVISVAATDRHDNKAFFSSYGQYVDMAAPGDGIGSTVPGGGYEFGRIGTSFSAPHVSGAAGLVIASGVCGTRGSACVRAQLEVTSDQTPGSGSFWKYGRLNACRAVGGCGQSPVETPAPPPTATPLPTRTPTVTPTFGPSPTPLATPRERGRKYPLDVAIAANTVVGGLATASGCNYAVVPTYLVVTTPSRQKMTFEVFPLSTNGGCWVKPFRVLERGYYVAEVQQPRRLSGGGFGKLVTIARREFVVQ